MTEPIAGWYTDPAGDTSKLRYWDGAKWTDNLMDAPAPEPQSAASIEPQAAAAAGTAAATASGEPTNSAAAVVAESQVKQPEQSTTAYDAAYQQPSGNPAFSTATQPGQPGQPGQPSQPGQPGVPAATVVSQDTYAPIYVNYGDAPLYYVSPQDSTLRLVAFILALISTITMGFAVIPLAWMIPMTVMTWQIYKGKRANTVGFDVCSLIFLNVVGGILLLVSTKEE